jgi:hypothetical protein
LAAESPKEALNLLPGTKNIASIWKRLTPEFIAKLQKTLTMLDLIGHLGQNGSALNNGQKAA